MQQTLDHLRGPNIGQWVAVDADEDGEPLENWYNHPYFDSKEEAAARDTPWIAEVIPTKGGWTLGPFCEN